MSHHHLSNGSKNCAWCHFSKYAHRDLKRYCYNDNMTVQEYIDRCGIDCPCGQPCPLYESFLKALLKFSMIKIKRFYCHGQHDGYKHLTMKDQGYRSERSHFRSRSPKRKNNSSQHQTKGREDGEILPIETLKQIPEGQFELKDVMDQVRYLQSEIWSRDYYIQQLLCSPHLVDMNWGQYPAGYQNPDPPSIYPSH